MASRIAASSIASAHPLRFLSRRILAANAAALRSPHAGRAVSDDAAPGSAQAGRRSPRSRGVRSGQRGPRADGARPRLPALLHLAPLDLELPGWDGIV